MSKSLEQRVVDMLFDELVHECRRKAVRGNDREVKFDREKVMDVARQLVEAEKQLKAREGGE